MPADAPRSTLTFDGNCAFCRKWVDFWRTLTGDRVDYRASTAPPRSVVYDTPDAHFIGAEAVFQLLAPVSGYEWMLRLYRNVPGVALLAELLYRLVATHRNAADHVTTALWGERIERPTYHKASGIFSRALAFIYLIAFASFGMQARGLVGSEGILPINIYFRIAATELGSAARWKVPLPLLVGTVRFRAAFHRLGRSRPRRHRHTGASVQRVATRHLRHPVRLLPLHCRRGPDLHVVPVGSAAARNRLPGDLSAPLPSACVAVPVAAIPADV